MVKVPTRVRRGFVPLCLAAAAFLPSSAAAQLQPAPPPPAPKVLAAYASTADAVRLPDGRLLNFVCMGEGSPTVILTAGLGDVSFGAWPSVQPQIARTTRVCAWDRPGFGFSDATAVPPTVATTTADLAAALATGKIPGPYVMVGHSLGAYESLLLADHRPDWVVGMVLVDPSIPDQSARAQRAGIPTPDPAANPVVQTFRRCAADIREGRTRFGGPDPGGCFAYPPQWPPALVQALGNKVSDPAQYETMAAFVTSSSVNSTLVVNPSRDYGDIPLIVLTAGMAPPPPPGASAEQLRAMAALDVEWNKGHDELAALSSRGINARVPGARHDIQGTKPQVVIDAIEAVVAEARAAAR